MLDDPECIEVDMRERVGVEVSEGEGEMGQEIWDWSTVRKGLERLGFRGGVAVCVAVWAVCVDLLSWRGESVSVAFVEVDDEVEAVLTLRKAEDAVAEVPTAGSSSLWLPLILLQLVLRGEGIFLMTGLDSAAFFSFFLRSLSMAVNFIMASLKGFSRSMSGLVLPSEWMRELIPPEVSTNMDWTIRREARFFSRLLIVTF